MYKIVCIVVLKENIFVGFDINVEIIELFLDYLFVDCFDIQLGYCRFRFFLFFFCSNNDLVVKIGFNVYQKVFNIFDILEFEINVGFEKRI